MIMSGGLPSGSVCSSNDVSALVEELQFSLGEGPCLDAFHRALPVLEPDLAHPKEIRWSAFSPPAVAAGVGAIFGFPMQVGAIRLGALNFYRDRPGILTNEQHADALIMADVATRAIVSMQLPAPHGQVAKELEAGSTIRYIVHQASGMIAAQLDVTMEEALIRLRARAFADGRPLSELSQDVVDRRLRFDDLEAP